MHSVTRRIALLGAESTGKTQLAGELAAHLRAQGLRAVAVPEVLREWCLASGRPPRPEEQLAIAREQERRIDAAARDHDFVIADTTALMVAIYAGMLQEDGELLRFARERQRSCDATLVTGLDLPWVADGLHRDAGQPREPVDALVRAQLQRAGVAFQVVYGQGPQRLRSALQALEGAGVLPAGSVPREESGGSRGTWTWACDKCSDPDCEHRLFSRLKAAQG
ncbi:MAG: ATP-binding protein [Burkholderiales bacterium]|nr:ATP-binding protein [Burkholderiales bacterium]